MTNENFKSVPGLVTLTKRDASDSIRGYVYQIDLSILRWISMDSKQIIELEYGEDISIVSRALTVEDKECSRLLEQVKLRNVSLTLNTNPARETLAYAFKTISDNPECNILYCYTTNAKIGFEQLSPIPNRIPAIEAWEQIRKDEINGPERSEVLQGIRILLSRSNKPPHLNEEIWKAFQDFITNANDEQLAAFIKRFEWSTRVPEAPQLTDQIIDLLLQKGHAQRKEEAQLQYERMFFRVTKLICQSGVKRLTKDELLIQLSLPMLSPEDIKLQQTIMDKLVHLEFRMDLLEEQISEVKSGLPNLIEQFIAQNEGITGEINYLLNNPSTQMPLPTFHLVNRVKTTEKIKLILEEHVWTAIQGGPGTGKTQLTILLVKTLGLSPFWITFRNLTPEQACVRLDAACSTVIRYKYQNNISHYLSQLCENLPEDSIIVLDDLPQLSNDREFSERFSRLVEVCSKHGIYLISTSLYSLPDRLLNTFSPTEFQCLVIPEFTDEEASELLKNLEVPPEYLDQEMISFMNIKAQGHALILTAIGKYLKNYSGTFEDNPIKALLESNYMDQINDETIKRVLETVEDENSRELLYRLCLISNGFSDDDVQALALAPPAINHPCERLATFKETWVQYEANSTLLISPLLREIGLKNLSPKTKKDCHLIIGDRIASKSILNQMDVLQAVSHFYAAQAFNQAGVLLIGAFNSLKNEGGSKQELGLLSIWAEQMLPEQMDLSIKLLLRGLQIATYYKFNMDASFLLTDLDSLLTQASSKDAWAVIGGLIPVISILMKIDTLRFNRYLAIAIKYLPQAIRPDGERIEFPQEAKLEVLIFASSMSMSMPNHILDWMTMVEQLPEDARIRAFEDKAAPLGCLMIAQKLYILEADKPVDDQQWQLILETLQELAERANRQGLELLWASAKYIRIIILGECLNELSSAVVEGQEGLKIASNNPFTQFLLKSAIGKQFLFFKDYENAFIWLKEATELRTTEAYPIGNFYALLDASKAVGENDALSAITHVKDAIDLAENNVTIPRNELIKALGELAIAYWLAGDLAASFDACDKVASQLFDNKDDSDQWKDLLIVFGHVSGYLTCIAQTDATPIMEHDPYPPPVRGLFRTHHPGRIAFYAEQKECLLMAQLAMFAAAVGYDDVAIKWSIRGLDMARAIKQPHVIASLSEIAIPRLVIEDHYAEVLDFAIEAGKILSITKKQIETGEKLLKPGMNIEAVLGEKESELRNQAEYNAIILGIIPISFRIGIISICRVPL